MRTADSLPQRNGVQTVDIAKHIRYWNSGAAEDWEVAVDLVRQGKTRHGLFFAHLALEKALKAAVCRMTGDMPPRTHNLVRLAQVAGLAPSPAVLDVLAEMNQYNVEGRYPGTPAPPLSATDAEKQLARCNEVLEWLKTQ